MSKTPFIHTLQKKPIKPNQTNRKKRTLRIKSTTAILPAFQCTDYKLDMFGVFTTKPKPN